MNNGMFEYRTQGYNGYAVKYSPFHDSRIAVAASSNFGLVGNGRLFVLELSGQGVQPIQLFDTQDSLYDVAWSEANESQLVVASGDGSIKLFDVNVNKFPVQSWQEHKREVYAVHWNQVAKDTFCSSSWDGTVKIWSPERPQSITTLPTHSCTYSAAFSPRSPSILSCVTSDSHLRIFDLRSPASASNHLVSLIPVHGPAPGPGQRSIGNNRQIFAPAENLTHDWNKYRETIIATAGVDSVIRTFDIRNPKAGPVALLQGHEYAVRKIAWSAHLSDTLLSASYDMTARVWSDGVNDSQQLHLNPAQHTMMEPTQGRELGRMNRHTEFVTGVDWCIHGAEGWCATVAWDERLLVWDVRTAIANSVRS